MHLQLQPIAEQTSAPSGRAGQARHDDLSLIAGYESGVREPAAWHHIGQHMRADAPPVRTRPRWLGRSSPRRNAVIRRRFVITLLLALVAAVLLVVNTTQTKPSMSKHSMYPPAAMQAGMPYKPNPGSYGAFSTKCGFCSLNISPRATGKRHGISACIDRTACDSRRKGVTA